MVEYGCIWKLFKGGAALSGYCSYACFAQAMTLAIEQEATDITYFLYISNSQSRCDTIHIPQVNLNVPNVDLKKSWDKSMTLELMLKWIDLLKLAGLPFTLTTWGKEKDVIPWYLVNVKVSEHFNNWGLVLHTLTLLRYPRSAPDCVAVLDILLKEIGDPKTKQQAWDYLNLCVRSYFNRFDFAVDSGWDGHAIVYNCREDWPSKYEEVIDTFKIQDAFSGGSLYYVHKSWEGKVNSEKMTRLWGITDTKFKQKLEMLKEKYNA